MKWLLRRTITYSCVLFLLSMLANGVHIHGGVITFFIAGIIMTILFGIIKPILQIIFIPLSLLTLGAFTYIIHIILLYILTVLYPQVSITSFVFQGATFFGFVIPHIAFNTFFAYIVCGVLIAFLISFVDWIFDK